MPHGRRRIDFQDFIVSHADENRLPAIKTAGVDTDFCTGEEPAHGQRFKPSLSVPLLYTVYGDQIVGRYI